MQGYISIYQLFFRMAFALAMASVILPAALAGQSRDARLENRLRRVESSAAKHEAEINRLKRQHNEQRAESQRALETLTADLIAANERLTTANSELQLQIESVRLGTEQSSSDSAGAIQTAKIITGIGLAAVALLGGLGFLLLKRRFSAGTEKITETIRKTIESLAEDAVKLDTKLVELLERQMSPPSGVVADNDHLANEPDHSLALRIADEINRIEKNLAAMDPAMRGHKQLSAAVRRMKDIFMANGYELVEMLNRKYDDGMKVIANFKPDDSLQSEEQIITRIIKPQVNFNGKMIQAAQIEVSQG